MRFKGTLVMLVICLLLGGYVYFYEIKGGEQREKAKEAEKQVWKLDSQSVRQIEILSGGAQITAVRQGSGDWKLTSPQPLDADSDELNSIANSASNIQRDSVIEPNATDLTKFGLSPARAGLMLKMKDGKEYGIDFGINNPTGNLAYAVLRGKKEVFLISSSVITAFEKKPDDLRNHKILSFDQPEAQSLSIKSSKGDLELEKDSNDRWWIMGKDRIAADSPGIRGILNALSLGRIKEFFNDPPESYQNLGLDKPLIDVRVTYGKNRAIKHLVIGLEKSALRKKGETGSANKSSDAMPSQEYLAKDESRPDLFFVEKDVFDKLLKTTNDIRDRALASIQRWDVDSITLTNSRGTYAFAKTGGEWFIAGSNKKAKWEGVNGILDAVEKPVKEWIDKPAAPPVYGLDKPLMHVVLKQGANVLADCAFGKAAKDGIYAQIKGDSSIKIADPEGLSILDQGESEFVEAAPPAVKK